MAIISRPIWAVGKLKRVQSSRDGGGKCGSLKVLSKTFMTVNVRANWTIVIQARGFNVLRHRDDDRFNWFSFSFYS